MEHIGVEFEEAERAGGAQLSLPWRHRFLSRTIDIRGDQRIIFFATIHAMDHFQRDDILQIGWMHGRYSYMSFGLK